MCASICFGCHMAVPVTSTAQVPSRLPWLRHDMLLHRDWVSCCQFGTCSGCRGYLPALNQASIHTALVSHAAVNTAHVAQLLQTAVLAASKAQAPLPVAFAARNTFLRHWHACCQFCCTWRDCKKNCHGSCCSCCLDTAHVQLLHKALPATDEDRSSHQLCLSLVLAAYDLCQLRVQLLAVA